MMELSVVSKANMSIVDKLIQALPDWENIIIKRHIKFVESYVENNFNLEKVGEEFNYSNNDMLSIFWRIQKKLTTEYDERIEKGIIAKPIVFISNNLQ
ncbi:hypothetical protein D3C81_428310 [compost metagenome]